MAKHHASPTEWCAVKQEIEKARAEGLVPFWDYPIWQAGFQQKRNTGFRYGRVKKGNSRILEESWCPAWCRELVEAWKKNHQDILARILHESREAGRPTDEAEAIIALNMLEKSR